MSITSICYNITHYHNGDPRYEKWDYWLIEVTSNCYYSHYFWRCSSNVIIMGLRSVCVHVRVYTSFNKGSVELVVPS